LISRQFFLTFYLCFAIICCDLINCRGFLFGVELLHPNAKQRKAKEKPRRCYFNRQYCQGAPPERGLSVKQKNPKKYTHCHGCGKKILLSHSRYCPDCVILDYRLHAENIPEEARKVFWAYIRKYGRRCYYSNVSLEIDDTTSPWYLVFSHPNTKDKTRIFPAAALVNEMKTGLNKKEFKYYALALDDHRKKHLKVRKISLKHWQGIGLLKGEKVCAGCGHAAALKHRKFCARCANIAFRMRHERFPREAINGVFDYIRRYGYICYYTGMELDLDDFNSPWYLEFDHWNPRDPRKMIITSSLVNKMKSDLTEEEFWYFISQLANHFRYGTPVRKRKLAYWCRPYQ